MAWGAPGSGAGVEDWVRRLVEDDPKLTSITVFRTRKFGDKEVEDLCTALESNSFLNDFSATHHPLTQKAAESFAKVLHNNRSLQSLSVGDSTFGDEGVRALAGGLSGNTTLQRLDLQNKGFGTAGATALQQAIAAGTGLDHLTLSKNKLGDDGIAAVAAAIPFVREVELQDCEISPVGARALAAGVEDAVAAYESGVSQTGAPPVKPRLQVLHLDGNNLGFSGTSALRPMLSLLRELHLGFAGLGDEGAAALATSVSAASPLELLDVNDNGIGPAGAASLAELLGTSPALRVLRMRGNRIGDEGAAALGHAIAEGPPLQELDVGGNQMGIGAADLLVRAPKLRKISLFASKLGNEGAALIADRLRSGSFLQLLELELSACQIGTDGMVRLFDVLESQAAPALEMLVVGCNPAVDEDGFQGRIEALHAARTELDVAWRPGDASSVQQLGGAPDVDLTVE